MNSSVHWSHSLWVLHRGTLEDHAAIYFAVNNVSENSNENPRGIADAENRHVAWLK